MKVMVAQDATGDYKEEAMATTKMLKTTTEKAEDAKDDASKEDSKKMELGQRASTKAQEGTYLQVPMPEEEDYEDEKSSKDLWKNRW